MQEALQAILSFGMLHMDFNRIEALIEPENIKSISLLKKIGFIEEGILRQYEYCRGVLQDYTMLSLLKSDYAENR